MDIRCSTDCPSPLQPLVYEWIRAPKEKTIFGRRALLWRLDHNYLVKLELQLAIIEVYNHHVSYAVAVRRVRLGRVVSKWVYLFEFGDTAT